MRGLTPEEHAGLTRLLLPVGSRDTMNGDDEEALRTTLVEQGRADYTAYGPWHPDYELFHGEWNITPLGREALRLYPLMLALQAQP